MDLTNSYGTTSNNGSVLSQTINRPSGLVTHTFTYDGDGRRVKKVSPTGATVYVYDAAGQLAAEYSTETNPESGTQYLTAVPLRLPPPC